ncbi:uncharacterized protein LOC126904067 isoform X2 [Daktulosphaira vitifoliae]|uniref:uncharacterized protein LOC126904067 isoform X2 n=1 Tax=Daktulosphaira vitifoliae TaxID=58002 RepID=UPI0021AABBE1|nr:uncharacterized protein LOC126904067 isoform X2 [Daktulosphaira vitifoliae]
METMKILDNSVIDLRYYLKIKPERDSETEKMMQHRLHPTNILLSGLFKDKRTPNGIDLLTGSPDPMDLFRSVPLNAKLENGNYANITTLYEMIQYDIDINCFIAYQRQIIAATIHPVYYWIGTFTQLLKKIVYSESNGISEIENRANIFKAEIGLLNKSIQKVIRTLISYKLFPENVQLDLEISFILIFQLEKFYNTSDESNLNDERIDHLYSKCENTMKTHLLKFGIDVNIPEIYNKEDCKKIISRLENKIKEIQLYVENLIHYKYEYNNIFFPKQLFASDFIFTSRLKCDIVEKHKHVYHLMEKMN